MMSASPSCRRRNNGQKHITQNLTTNHLLSSLFPSIPLKREDEKRESLVHSIAKFPLNALNGQKAKEDAKINAKEKDHKNIKFFQQQDPESPTKNSAIYLKMKNDSP